MYHLHNAVGRGRARLVYWVQQGRYRYAYHREPVQALPPRSWGRISSPAPCDEEKGEVANFQVSVRHGQRRLLERFEGHEPHPVTLGQSNIVGELADELVNGHGARLDDRPG